MKLKITNSTLTNTQIINAETGEILEGVTKAVIECNPMEPPICTLTLFGVQVEMLAKLPGEVEYVQETS